MWGPFLLLTGWPHVPQLLAGDPASGEECSLFAKAKSLFVMFPWITYSCVSSWTTALTQLTWQHHTPIPDPPSQEKMEYLLVSHFTKTGSSTIYKLNRNFHYFSWHNWLYLTTGKGPSRSLWRPALAKASSGRGRGQGLHRGTFSSSRHSFILPHHHHYNEGHPHPRLQLV